MTCAGAETWLLTARAASELPDSVRAHLTECRGCAKRLSALIRTDAAVRRLAPEPSPAARQRLADAIERTPRNAPKQATGEPARAPQWPSRWVARVAIGVAAALLVAVGWIAGRATSPKPVVQTPPANEPAPVAPPVQPKAAAGPPIAPHPSSAAGLTARAARHASRVAADANPVAQAEALDEFAASVRAEVVLRANAGDAECLPRLTGLHERLLTFGVAHQIARSPEEQRQALATRIADGLKTAADDVSAASAKLPPAMLDLLKPLSVACREAAEGIRQAKPPGAPGEWPSPPTPLESIAAQTIRVADTNEPLARANECTQLAATIAQSAAVLSAAGQTDDAGRLGDSLAAVFDAGVAGNLERVESADPTGTLRKEVTLVRERAERAMEPLEREVAKANPVARPGLEKALVASAPGQAKATGKPPKHAPPGKGGMPPGWQKKP